MKPVRHTTVDGGVATDSDRLPPLVDVLPEALVLHDTDGTIHDANEQACENLGYTREQLRSMRISDIEVGYEPEELQSLWAEIVCGQRERIEGKHRRADGSTFPAEVTIQKVELDGEERFIGLCRDITERKEYELMLEEQRDNLEILNQVVRHDIRNDMMVIRARTELLESHIDEAGQQHLDSVLNATDSAVDLTRTARDLSETMLSTEADVEPVSLIPHLSGPLEALRSQFPEAVITADRIPDVRVRGNDLLEAVFRNLIHNAVVHNDKDVCEVDIRTATDDGTVTVIITDNGPGIPDPHKEQIFGKEQKGLDSPGTGIGLYLVRTLLDQYGGNVRVEDNEPAGSVFTVTLSIASE